MSPLRVLSIPALLLGLVAAGCHQIHYEKQFAPGEIVVYDDLFAVSVVDPQHAVAVGYYGAAYRTKDGGGTWTKGQTPTKHSLYDVSMADARRGWAVGQRGLILRTEDGGATWAAQPNLKADEGSHLFAVHAVDANTAWAVGTWGSRIYTDDGGLSWQDFSLTIDEFHPQFVWLAPPEQDQVRAGEKVYEDVGLNDVFCARPPSKRCWIVGEFGYIFHSENQGRTWERAEIRGDIHMDAIAVGYNVIQLDPPHVEALNEFAAKVADVQHLNIEISPLASAREIAVFGRSEDPTELFEILEARAQEVRLVLEEAGILSDRLRMRGSPAWDYEDFLEDDPTFLDRYLESRRAKRPGVRVGVAQNPYLFTIRFRDDEFGLIAGLGGVMMRSADGGRSWEYRETGRKQALFSVGAVDSVAIAVGEKGLVRFSEDRGNTWMPPKPANFPSVFTFMRDVDFDPDGNVGLIVGQNGMVIRTRDRGRSWQKVFPAADGSAGT